MRKLIGLIGATMLAGTVAFALLASYGTAGLGKSGPGKSGPGKSQLKAKRMSSYLEVPAISTTAKGSFEAKVSGSKIDYKLTYSGLSSAAQVAHIHFGQRSVAGGVAAFLCGGGGKPACPPSGTVTGTIVASDVIGPAAQGIAPGEIGELIAAMRAGRTYANVHTTNFPGGELRGQINDDNQKDD